MEKYKDIPVIEESLLTLSKNGDKSVELNWVSFYNKAPKFSVHDWLIVDGEKIARKGLTLSNDEMKALVKGILEHGEALLSVIEPSDDKAHEKCDLIPMRAIWRDDEQMYKCMPIQKTSTEAGSKDAAEDIETDDGMS